MKKIFTSFLVLAILLSACGELQISDPTQPVEVAAGKEFTIVLEANPTTGYHWEFVEEPDAAIVEFVSRDYNADAPVTTGSGGVDVWTFRAVAPGEIHITLGYYPPSFDPVEPQQTVTFTVTVK
ncbi:MAG: protease inhibitor I42 family protein [Anaerolineales bacterium]|nr:protease inhibitor I42 family protein [Anaerolineales bacterium]